MEKDDKPSDGGSKPFFSPQDAALKQKSTGKKNENKKNTRKYLPGYQSWANMKTRCTNKKHCHYKTYGGSGITFDPAWDTFEKFIEDMGPPPGPLYTLDRIDTAGNYEKSNCRWATKKEQTRNRRNTKKISYFGEELPIAELAERHGQAPETVARRLKAGYSADEALHTPVKWGGDRISVPLGSPDNRWPTALKAELREAFEKEYVADKKFSPDLTRPYFFLINTYQRQTYYTENYWKAPEPDRPDELQERAELLNEMREEAKALLKRLGVAIQRR